MLFGGRRRRAYLIYRSLQLHLALKLIKINKNEFSIMLKNDEIDHLLRVSLNCVEKAMETAKKIYSNKQTLSVGNKPDNTPVTIADYCCQYIIMKDLKENFP